MHWTRPPACAACWRAWGWTRPRSRWSATWPSCRARPMARWRWPMATGWRSCISSAAAMRRSTCPAKTSRLWWRASTFKSRLIIGTGKYKDYAMNAAALEASGAEIVTVAVRRVNLTDPQPAHAGGFHRSEESDVPAQHRRLLHRRRRGAHLAPGARGGRLGPGEAGSAGREEAALSRHDRDAARHRDAGQGWLPGHGLLQRRSA